MKYLAPDQPLLIIIGPSGSGKSTAIRKLHAQGLIELTPSWTTRPPRPGEIEGSIEHCFVNDKEFSKKVKEGFFLEVVTLFGLPYRYGLPKIVASQPKHIPTIMLRAKLIFLVPKHYSRYVIYQIEDEFERVKERLGRKVRGNELGSRLVDYEPEISMGRKLANRVFYNDTVDSLVSKIKKALHKDFRISK